MMEASQYSLSQKKLLENTSIVNLTKAPHYLVSDDLSV